MANMGSEYAAETNMGSELDVQVEHWNMEQYHKGQTLAQGIETEKIFGDWKRKMNS